MTRDLKADLALCEAATAGPWEANKQSAAEWCVWHVELDVCVASRRSVGAPPREHVGLTERDAAMIAASREGWPYALSLVEELGEALRAQIRYDLHHDSCRRRGQCVDCIRLRVEAIRRREAALAKVRGE